MNRDSKGYNAMMDNFNDINKIVLEEIRRVSASNRLSKYDIDDLQQNCWLFLIESEIYEMPHPYIRICVRRRLYRLLKQRNSYSINESLEDLSNISEESVNFNRCYERSFEDDSISTIDILTIVDSLPDRLKKFAAIKSFVLCDIDMFREYCEKIFSTLDTDDICELFDKNANDDSIMRIIYGVVSGTNSGSVRKIKKDLRILLK